MASRPRDAVLGIVEGNCDVYCVNEEEGGQTIPGLLIYRFEASLVFFNADYFSDRVRTFVSKSETKPKYFLFDAESVPILDVSAAFALESLRAELAGQGIVLGIARARGLFRIMLEGAGVAKAIGKQNLFPTVHAGVRSFQEWNGLLKERSIEAANF